MVLVASFARFKSSMAAFNAGITLLGPFRRWRLSAIVDAQGAYEKAMRDGDCEGDYEP